MELLTRNRIPHKNFFPIAEVADLLNVKPHEIRHWETELPQIQPQRSKSGQRIYRRDDVLLFFAIKNLVYDKKLTIAGAQRILAQADEHFFASMGGTSVSTPDKALKSEKKVYEDPHNAANTHEKNQILEEASKILLCDEDDDEFDDHTHQIYQRYAEDLENVELKIDPIHVGEMLQDALALQEHVDKKAHHMSKHEYEHAFARLTQSKNSLLDVLMALDKYRESGWWPQFDQASDHSL